jgi:hypothetical protein
MHRARVGLPGHRESAAALRLQDDLGAVVEQAVVLALVAQEGQLRGDQQGHREAAEAMVRGRFEETPGFESQRFPEAEVGVESCRVLHPKRPARWKQSFES